MSQSLFQKGRLVVLGNAHDLLNKLIDTNSPAAMKQYVRDVETQLFALQTEVAAQDGQLRTMRRENTDLQTKIANNEAMITRILGGTDANKETIAKQQAAVVVGQRSQFADKATQITAQETTVTSLQQAVRQLQSKHDEMLNKVRDLERMDRDSKAKERAVQAVRSVNQIMGGADSFSVDDVQARMASRNDVANAAFDHEMGTLAAAQENPVTDENASAVDDLLSKLRPQAEAEVQETPKEAVHA